MSRQYPAATVAPPTGARAESFLAVAADGRTYRNLGYLLLALPLGLSSFLLLAALCAGLALTLLGLPIPPAVAAGSRRLVAFERRLAGALLGERLALPPAVAETVAVSGSRAAVKAAPRDGAAVGTPWRGPVFLAARLPLGLVAFATVAATYGPAVGLLLAPVTYRLEAVADPIRVGSFEEAFVSFLVAPLAILAAMHVSNALAAAFGRFARLMLAPER